MRLKKFHVAPIHMTRAEECGSFRAIQNLLLMETWFLQQQGWKRSPEGYYRSGERGEPRASREEALEHAKYEYEMNEKLSQGQG